MMSLLRAFFKRVPGKRHIALLFRLSEAYLTDTGWNQSVLQQQPLNKLGKPIPWLTYSIIHFLSGRVHDEMTVFEFGSGNSTHWFSERVKHITSVEHDTEWYEKLKPILTTKTNVTYLHRPLGGNKYPETIKQQNTRYDIVIVDGRERVRCGKLSAEALTEKGVIIWDNADREIYEEGYDYLIDRGFRRIDFVGLSPGMHYQSATAVFYRPGNCLNI